MKRAPRRWRTLALALTACAAGLLAAELARSGTLTVRPGIPSVGGQARYGGSHGLEINVASPNTNAAFVQSNHPAAEPAYRVRFYVNPRNLTMADGDEFDLFSAFDGADPVPPTVAGNALLRLELRQVGGEKRLSAFVRRDNGTEAEIPADVPLPNGWHRVEVNWTKATAAGANNGLLQLWVDGVAQTGLSGLDNDAAAINYARWGTVAGVDAGTSGTIRLDDFASQRQSYIGPQAVFADVTTANGLWPFIHGLYNAEVTSGCGGGNFCPNNNVTRDQMAVFLLTAEGTPLSSPTCTTQIFNDVPCSNPFSPWINELVARGVTGGCGGGNYCPGNNVTRDQMAVFLLITLEGQGYTPPACTTPVFNDVPCSNGFAPWINELAARGITGGCGGGNYCPGNAVTRGQMAVFLTSTFELPVPAVGP